MEHTDLIVLQCNVILEPFVNLVDTKWIPCISSGVCLGVTGRAVRVAGCRVECCFCREELLEACLCCRAWNTVGHLILPCRMLGYTGGNCWKLSVQNEPCSCCISLEFLVVELILSVELIL